MLITLALKGVVLLVYVVFQYMVLVPIKIILSIVHERIERKKEVKIHERDLNKMNEQRLKYIEELEKEGTL